MIMALPGYRLLPFTARTIISLGVAICIAGIPGNSTLALPVPPYSFIQEAIFGALIASIIRLLEMVSHIAGSIISGQMGLSAAMAFDLGQEQQNPVLTGVLSTVFAVLFLSRGYDLNVMHGIAASYKDIPLVTPEIVRSLPTLAFDIFKNSFNIGIQVAMPFIILNFALNVAIGLIGKVVPQLQVFSIIFIVQLGGGLGLLMVVLGGLTLFAMQFYAESIQTILPW